MQEVAENDLGFTFRETKNGEIIISHHGKRVTILRSNQAAKFKKRIDVVTFSEQQQQMARLTGNYKRGNERLAKKHTRNR